LEADLREKRRGVVPDGSAIFLDTTIQIALVVYSPEMKDRIRARIGGYRLTVSSDVVKQEFKRRLLKEAQYLLNQLNRLNSLVKVQRHVVDHLTERHNRKRNISLEILTTLFEEEDDADRTERAKRYLDCLIQFGLDDLEESTGSIIRDSGCACAKNPIRKRKSGDYDFGTDKCSKTDSECGIRSFLEGRRSQLDQIRDALASVPADKKTDELERAHPHREIPFKSREYCK
jgi:hypothetical protein